MEAFGSCACSAFALCLRWTLCELKTKETRNNAAGHAASNKPKGACATLRSCAAQVFAINVRMADQEAGPVPLQVRVFGIKKRHLIRMKLLSLLCKW